MATPWSLLDLKRLLRDGLGVNDELAGVAITVCDVTPGQGDIRAAANACAQFLASQGALPSAAAGRGRGGRGRGGRGRGGPTGRGGGSGRGRRGSGGGRRGGRAGRGGGQALPPGFELLELTIEIPPNHTGGPLSVTLPDGNKIELPLPPFLPPGSNISVSVPCNIEEKLKREREGRGGVTIGEGAVSEPTVGLQGGQGLSEKVGKPVEVPGITCPNHKKLLPSMARPEAQLSCDKCTSRVPPGSLVLTCRECDFDVCVDCQFDAVEMFENNRSLAFRQLVDGTVDLKRMDEANRAKLPEYKQYLAMLSKANRSRFERVNQMVTRNLKEIDRKFAHKTREIRSEAGKSSFDRAIMGSLDMGGNGLSLAYRGLHGMEMMDAEPEVLSSYVADLPPSSGYAQSQSEGYAPIQAVNKDASALDKPKEEPKEEIGSDPPVSAKDLEPKNASKAPEGSATASASISDAPSPAADVSKGVKDSGENDEKAGYARTHQVGKLGGEKQIEAEAGEGNSPVIAYENTANAQGEQMAYASIGYVQIGNEPKGRTLSEASGASEGSPAPAYESKILLEDTQKNEPQGPSEEQASTTTYGKEMKIELHDTKTENSGKITETVSGKSSTTYGKEVKIGLDEMDAKVSQPSSKELRLITCGMFNVIKRKRERFVVPKKAVTDPFNKWGKTVISDVCSRESRYCAVVFLKNFKKSATSGSLQPAFCWLLPEEKKLSSGVQGIEDSTLGWFGRPLKTALSRPVNDQMQGIKDTVGISRTQNKERRARYEKMQNYIIDFIKPFLRFAVEEYHLPPPLRRSPMPCNLGGLAGGDKYLINGMLLKFAIDSHGIFGSDEDAAKVAWNETRMNHLVAGEDLERLHVPVTFTFRLNGFTIVATALAPIQGDDSLIYGTPDAGKTIRNTDPLFESLVSDLANTFHLAKHPVAPIGGKKKPRKTRGEDKISDVKSEEKKEKEKKQKEKKEVLKEEVDLWLAADIEGHQSLADGRYYLIDLARFLPPVPPRPGARADHLVRLFRPEFMRKETPVPLSADVFSGFGILKKETLFIDAHRAFTHLITKSVPRTVDLILKEVKDGTTNLNLSSILHTNGVNIRYLGLIFAKLAGKNDSGGEKQIECAKQIVCYDMVMRCIKIHGRQCLRKCGKELALYLFSKEFEKWRSGVKNYKKKNKKFNILDLASDSLGFEPTDHCDEVLNAYKEMSERERLAVIFILAYMVFGNGPTAEHYWKEIIPQAVRAKFAVGCDGCSITMENLRAEVLKVREFVKNELGVVTLKEDTAASKLFRMFGFQAVGKVTGLNMESKLISEIVKFELPTDRAISENKKNPPPPTSEEILAFMSKSRNCIAENGIEIKRIIHCQAALPLKMEKSVSSLFDLAKQQRSLLGEFDCRYLSTVTQMLLMMQKSIDDREDISRSATTEEAKKKNLEAAQAVGMDADDIGMDAAENLTEAQTIENAISSQPSPLTMENESKQLEGLKSVLNKFTEKIPKGYPGNIRLKTVQVALIEYVLSLIKPLTKEQADAAAARRGGGPAARKVADFAKDLQIKMILPLGRESVHVPWHHQDMFRNVCFVRALQAMHIVSEYFDREEKLIREGKEPESGLRPEPDFKRGIPGVAGGTMDLTFDPVCEIFEKTSQLLYHLGFDLAVFCLGFRALRRSLLSVDTPGLLARWLVFTTNATDRLRIPQMKIQLLTLALDLLALHRERIKESDRETERWELELSIYHNLGVVYESMDPQKALETYKKGIAKAKSLTPKLANNRGRDPTQSISTYSLEAVTIQLEQKMANVYGRLTDFQTKLTILKKLKSRVMDAFGPNHMKYARHLNHMGEASTALGKYQEAEGYLQESIKIGRSLGSVPYTHFYNYAHFCDILGRFEQSVQIMTEALKYAEKLHGMVSPQVATCLRRLASSYSHLNRFTEQREVAERAIGIYDKLGIKSGQDYAMILQTLGVCYLDRALATGGFDRKNGKAHDIGETIPYLRKAKEYMLRSHQTFSEAKDKRISDMAMIKINIGNVIGYLGENEEKIRLNQEALQIYKQIMHGREDNDSCANIHANMGQTYLTMGDYTNAHKSLNSAFNIYSKIFGPQHNSTVPYLHISISPYLNICISPYLHIFISLYLHISISPHTSP
ncbi:hypothetical protein AAMO2058_001252700 [Amorphochlora amoebiformis]